MIRRGGGFGPHIAGGDHNVWAGILLAVFAVALITAIVLLVVWLARRSRHDLYPAVPAGHGPAAIDSALEILNTRYARGEIDKAEYEEKKKDLSG